MACIFFFVLLKSFSDGAYKTGLSEIGTYGCLAVDGEQVFRTHLATFFFWKCQYLHFILHACGIQCSLCFWEYVNKRFTTNGHSHLSICFHFPEQFKPNWPWQIFEDSCYPYVRCSIKICIEFCTACGSLLLLRLNDGWFPTPLPPHKKSSVQSGRPPQLLLFCSKHRDWQNVLMCSGNMGRGIGPMGVGSERLRFPAQNASGCLPHPLNQALMNLNLPEVFMSGRSMLKLILSYHIAIVNNLI